MARQNRPEDLGPQVRDALQKYGDLVQDDLEEVIRDLAKEGAKRVRAGAPRASWTKPKGERTWHYRQKITFRKQKTGSPRKALSVIYAGKHEYSLTHLLERGHRTRLKAGGKGKAKTAAIPHWAPGERYVIENFEKELLKKIKENKGE